MGCALRVVGVFPLSAEAVSAEAVNAEAVRARTVRAGTVGTGEFSIRLFAPTSTVAAFSDSRPTLRESNVYADATVQGRARICGAVAKVVLQQLIGDWKVARLCGRKPHAVIAAKPGRATQALGQGEEPVAFRR